MTFKAQTYAGRPPCYGCADRHIKCHAECERYKEWLNKLEAIKREREKSLEYTRYLADKAKKHKYERGSEEKAIEIDDKTNYSKGGKRICKPSS